MTIGTNPLIAEKQIRRKSRSRDEIYRLGCSSGDSHGPSAYILSTCAYSTVDRAYPFLRGYSKNGVSPAKGKKFSVDLARVSADPSSPFYGRRKGPM